MRFKILLLSILIFVFSCEEDSKIEFTETNITTDTNKIVEINIPIAIGNENISDSINQAINNIIIANLRVDNLESPSPLSITESINAFNKEYSDFKTDFPESSLEWEAQIDGEIMYQSENVISIAITTYLNTGGAHGNLIISFLNFDAQTGNEIETENLFNDFAAFEKLAKNHFNNEIADKKDEYFEPNNFTLPENIGYDDEGIILLYNTYEIAPYSSGITEIIIPYNDTLNSLLNFL